MSVVAMRPESLTITANSVHGISFLLQSFKVKLGKLKAWAALEFVANWTRTHSFAHYFVIVIMVSSAPKNSSEQPQGYRPKWLHYLAEQKYV